MLKTVFNMLVGALITAAFATAIAQVGTPPGTGFQLVDSAWLNGLASGRNNTYQSGITAAGTTQATATQLSSNIYMMQVDTTPASAGVALPPCINGTELSVYNNGLQTLTIYPSILSNQALSPAAQDTINNGTSTTATTHTPLFFSCAKNGVWSAK